ncbi:MAG: Lpg1974 family pore-forming outer membrane protein [Parachlamydiales bacterium]
MKGLLFALPFFLMTVFQLGWSESHSEDDPYISEDGELLVWEDDEISEEYGFYGTEDPMLAENQRQQEISQSDSVKSASNARLYRYRPRVDKHGWYARGEYLFWKAEEGELDYVLTNAQSSGFTGATGKLKEVGFDWASGLRVAAGFVFSPDYWTLEGQYTWIKPTGEDSAHASGSNFLQGTYTQANNAPIESAHSRITLSYQLGELILAKRFQFSNQILCRFHSGLIGAWIEQDWNIYYKDSNPPGHIHQKWQFQGGGLQVGILGDWFFGRGVSMLVQARGALLYGAYDNHLHDTSGSNLVAGPKYHDHRVASTMQIILGPSWGRVYRHWGVNISVGYELNVWFNLQQVLRSLATAGGNNGRDSRHSNANVALQGVTTRLQLDF